MEPRPESDALDLVPNEGHAEQSALAGRRWLTRRALQTSAAAAASSARPSSPEVTRLACARVLGRGGRYAAAFDNAIGALRRAGVTAQELALDFERARVFQRVIGEVDVLLGERGLRDERADAWLAAQTLLAGTVPELSGCRTVHVRGACRFDAGDREFFGALQRRVVLDGGHGVVLELPTVQLPPLAAAVDRIASDLEAHWAAAEQHPSLEYASATSPELDLIVAHDDYSEARAVAHAASRVLSSGVPIDRIAIAVPELSEAFLEPLRQELENARIPFFEPRGRPVFAAPHAHAALELMSLASGPVHRDLLLDVLRTPGLRADVWSGKELSAHAWANELAQLPITVDRRGDDLLSELAERAREAARAGRDPTLLETCREATARCLHALGELRSPRPRAAFRAGFEQLFAELGLSTPSPATLALALERRAGGRRELLRALSDNAAALRALSTAFERTVDAGRDLGLAGEPVALDDYLPELELSLEGVGPSRGARRAGALCLGRPSELAGLAFDHVILCRATAQHLDAGESGGDELLGDELCAALPRRRRPPTRGLLSSFSALAVAWLFARSARLTVTLAARDARGPSTESQLVLALRKQAVPERREPASPLHPGAHRVRARVAPDENAQARAAAEATRQQYFLDPRLPAGPFTGAAGDLSSLVGGSAERPVPVTALERYATCPFLAFAGLVLRALRDEIPGDGVGIRERGSLLHQSLAVAHEAIRPHAGNLAPDELKRLAMEAASAYLDSRGKSALRRAGLSTALIDVEAVLGWSLAEGAGLSFYEAERAFGAGHAWGPLDVGGRFVSGRIDRIDRSSDGARLRVIDYKTGKPPTRPELQQTLLQPWLYGEKAALELGAGEVSVGYVSLGDRAPRLHPSSTLAPDSELVQNARARARRALELLAAGAVEPRPSEARRCLRCDGRDICRRPLSAPLSSDEEES